MVGIIRALVRDELSALCLGDIADVTRAHPHTEAGDANNGDRDVRLRQGGRGMRRVPQAPPHVGMVGPLQEGDLVLLSYVGADPNRPVAVARPNSNASHRPIHEAGKWRVESPLAGTASIAIDTDQSIVATAGKTVLTLRRDGAALLAWEADLAMEVKGNVAIMCEGCSIDASGTIALGAAGDPVITEGSHKCCFSGHPLVGSGSVKAKG